jgi:tetratricopeptide (TPR) repeat protein
MKESPSNYNRIGMTLGRRGRYAEAVEAFERALELKPDFAPAYHNLGLAWQGLGETAKSIAAYRRAVELDPTNVEPYCGLANVLASLGRDDEAFETMRRAVETAPTSFKGHFNYGVACERVLAWETAAAAYRASVELYPLNTDAYVRLARLCLFVLDRPDEAVETLTRALEFDADDARVRSALDEALAVVVR